TAVRDRAADAGVAIARSDRSLEVWQQSAAAVIGPPADQRLTETRDPYVFSFGGHRYAVQGTGGPESDPAILLYGCDDLEHWTELGVLLDYSDPAVRRIAESTTWECPNLFPLGDHWVLMLSCNRRGELAGVYLIGDLEPAAVGLRFLARSGGLVDQGPAFYAPQVLATGDRVLIWGWARELGRTDEDLLRAGWAGSLSFPRELRIDGDRLLSRPAPELDRLRSKALPAGSPVTERSFELRAAAGLRLELIDHDQRQVVADEPGAVRVLVDGSLIEIFPAAATPRTVRAYPTAASAWHVDGTEVLINRLDLPGS
ncbi:MAG: glycoside hydrolase family 32 protein, partial [Microlunatus sp.]|nr:glycoside hydrolase family 32 protein [Microlunatus sp.]